MKPFPGIDFPSRSSVTVSLVTVVLFVVPPPYPEVLVIFIPGTDDEVSLVPCPNTVLIPPPPAMKTMDVTTEAKNPKINSLFLSCIRVIK